MLQLLLLTFFMIYDGVARAETERHTTEELLLRGEALRASGFVNAALAAHEQAWQQAENASLKHWAARDSAETLLAMHRYPEATARLNTIQRGSGDVGQRSQVALLRGHLEAKQSRADKARTAYLHAQKLARQAGLTTVSVQAQLGLLDLAPATVAELEAVAKDVRMVNLPVQTELWLELAQRATTAQHPELAQQFLQQALPHVAAGRQQAEALALQAAILEATGCYTAALVPTDAAIHEAQRIGAEDLLLQEEWRRGRLYLALGDKDRAVAALRRAMYHLKIVRLDLPVEYRAGHSSFRETLSPLYLSLTDILLQQTAQQHEAAAQPLLLEARDLLEQLKAAELQDYLGESCQMELNPVVDLEAISPHTAVLYPILLPDRLELLLGIGKHQYQATVPIPAQTVRDTAKSLADKLRKENKSVPVIPLEQVKPIANQLFSWLIAPIKSRLEAGKIQTLVVVPDGPLRLFPFSALMDGDTFLVEHYAVVTAPSLTLLEPQPLTRGKVQALVVGISEPGPVADEYAATVYGMKDMNSQERNEVKQALKLPGVKDEVNAVAQELGSTPLLNEEFSSSSFSQAMATTPWRVVHIATHGSFGDSPDNSYVMAHDRLLKMSQLESIFQGNDNPPELLVLSACETAEGDDRAPLGLTGVAVQSGVKSAIGSLWPVSDDATTILIKEFYRRLPNPTRTKAQAFQQAQLLVLHQKQHRHPYYWSPFILIGNWL